mgnify:CR=1 FL=1
MTLGTGFRILMSRWKRGKLTEDVIKKRELCAKCEHNFKAKGIKSIFKFSDLNYYGKT